MQLSSEISTRPSENSDLDFCLRLYVESRKDEVEAFGWNEEKGIAFLRMQFAARERAYLFQFPGLVDEIILEAGSPVGRILTSIDGDTLLLVDIAIFTDRQGLGIGAVIIRELQTRAAKRMFLRVNKDNHGAIELYRKLGFTIENEGQLQYSMSWSRTIEEE